jgi:hypothetical protein
MPIELRWLASTAASSLHAAQAIHQRRSLADRATADAIAAEAQALTDDLAATGLDATRFFEHAVPLATRFDAPRDVAEVAVAKLLGPYVETDIPARLARRLIALQAAFQRANPRALEELELRSEPLREQWEARGPGLLAAVARRTEDDLVVAAADVILVHPLLGGGGAAYSLYNSVCIEAVLANPIAELAEVARLGWLLAQLNLDLPKFHGSLNRDRLLEIWPLAMIPPVLAAAREVELVRFDAPTLAKAVAAWTSSAIDPQMLHEWWDTYESTSPPWPVALGALERMIAEA